MSDILQSLNQSDDQHDIYERKYYALKRKCEEVQQVLCFDKLWLILRTRPSCLVATDTTVVYSASLVLLHT